jgi:hypothetical protein
VVPPYMLHLETKCRERISSLNLVVSCGSLLVVVHLAQPDLSGKREHFLLKVNQHQELNVYGQVPYRRFHYDCRRSSA